MSLPAGVRTHLEAPSLSTFWRALRMRLERTGHAIAGSVAVDLDHDAADRLGGLLGRAMPSGSGRIPLAELDAALRSSAAARGLVAVVAELTGGPLRDRPAERATRDADWRESWAALDSALADAGLATRDWVPSWVAWLHGGVVARLGAAAAAERLRIAVAVLAALDLATSDSVPQRTYGEPDSIPGRTLGQLASTITGTAHGLDDGRTVPTLVLRAASIALGIAPPTTGAQRRELWRRLGVEPDAVSGTVLTWALRPPGVDAWSAMMRSRADLGLVTHLTVRELRAHDVALAGEPVHACENPQVLQHLADAGADRPLGCFFGNPSSAAALFLARAAVRYHGDFDWPGVAIARRVFAAGAEPWLFSAADYLDAVEHLPTDRRLALAGPPEATPWDPALHDVMVTTGVAVHEEAVVDQLAADL